MHGRHLSWARRSTPRFVSERYVLLCCNLHHPGAVFDVDSMCGERVLLIAVAGGLQGAASANRPKSPREIHAFALSPESLH